MVKSWLIYKHIHKIVDMQATFQVKFFWKNVLYFDLNFTNVFFLRVLLTNESELISVILSWWRHPMETLSRCLPFVWGIRRSPLNSPHKGQWRGALMFSLICAWINGCVKNREAGDLRRHRAHYDVIDIWCQTGDKPLSGLMMTQFTDTCICHSVYWVISTLTLSHNR